MSSRGQQLLGQLGAFDLPPGALELRPDEAMARHTTLRLGGPADVWARPVDAAALQQLLARCHALGLPVTFVGGGSNLLVRDGGIRGVVINLGRMNRVVRPDDDDPTHVVVDAGATTGRLLQHVTGWELGGLEFLGGVPGSVGGGLIMNAGTYLGEFTKVVTAVHSLHRDGRARTRDHAACGFRYRGSDLPPDEIVVSADLRLWPRARAEIEADVAGLRERRRQREPSAVANNGSTFKNPPGDYAGRIIESVGLKGHRIGAAVVSPVHANWLVVSRPGPDVPEARACDLIALIETVRARVREAAGVTLELEVKITGEAAMA